MKNDNYKVAFFVLLGIVVLCIIIGFVIVNSNSDKNEDSEIVETEECIDDKIINFLNDKKDKISSTFTRENAKELFVTVVDFMFYDGEISGHKLDELTEESRIKVAEIVTLIEIKIEDTFPGLIDGMSDKYKDIKTNIIDNYTNLINSYCNKNGSNCNKIKDTYNNINSKFKNTFNIVKEKINEEKEKLDNWYKEYKN